MTQEQLKAEKAYKVLNECLQDSRVKAAVKCWRIEHGHKLEDLLP